MEEKITPEILKRFFKSSSGVRPKITNETPKCFAKLMKRCWDTDPAKRPSIIEIRETFCLWYNEKESADSSLIMESFFYLWSRYVKNFSLYRAVIN